MAFRVCRVFSTLKAIVVESFIASVRGHPKCVVTYFLHDSFNTLLFGFYTSFYNIHFWKLPSNDSFSEQILPNLCQPELNKNK